MSEKEKPPKTRAIRTLDQAGIQYGEHLYPYVDKGGTASVADALQVDEHQVIKTLVFEDSDGAPCIVLMHGGRRGFITDMDPADLGRALDLHPVNVAIDPRG